MSVDPDKALYTFISEFTRGKVSEDARGNLLVAGDYIEEMGGDATILRMPFELEQEWYPPKYEFTPDAVKWVLENAVEAGRIEEGDPEQVAVRFLMGDDDIEEVQNRHGSYSQRDFLMILGWMVGTFGLEGFREDSPSDEVDDLSVDYLNTGDTYSETLIIDGWDVDTGSWGGVYEEWEEKLAEDGWTRDDAGEWVQPITVEMGNFTAELTAIGEDSQVPDNPGAVDAEIYYQDNVIGEVTLIPNERGDLDTWGSQDMWADQAVQDFLYHVDWRQQSDVINEIVAAVRDAPGIPPSESNPRRDELKRKLMR